MLKQLLLLLLCTALLLCSCTQSTNPGEKNESGSITGTTERPGLVIEDAFIPYTEEDYETLSTRLTEILRRAVYLSRNIALSADQKANWKEDLRSRRLPAAEAKQIPAETLKALLTEVETALNGWEAADQPGALSASDILQHFFAQALGLLGAEDAGALAYDNVLFFLDDSILHAEQTYQKTNYPVYLQQANDFRALQKELTEEVGSPVFSDICAAMFFGDTLLSRLLSNTSSDSLDTLTDAEQVLLLQKQAEGLLEDPITARQWQICLRVFDRLSDKADLIDGNLTTLQSGVLNACLSDSYLNAMGDTMPNVIAYYAELVRSMSAEDLQALKNSDQNARSAAICSLLLRNEASFRKIAETLSVSLASQSEAEQKKLNRYWNTYLAYAEGIPAVELDTLIADMQHHKDACTDTTRTALFDTVEAYLFGVVPYVTFAFFH